MENTELESFANCRQPKEILDAMLDIRKKLHGFLLLSGLNGSGKSYAARAIYNSLCLYRPPAYDRDICIFITQAEMNFEFIEHQKIYGETNSFLGMIRKTKLLVLDDLGTRTPSDSFMDFIYAIIDYRYNNGLATVITTNLNSIDMRARFGDAFVSRVASGKFFRLENEDRRIHKDF